MRSSAVLAPGLPANPGLPTAGEPGRTRPTPTSPEGDREGQNSLDLTVPEVAG